MSGGYTLRALAHHVDATVVGDAQVVISRVAAIQSAQAGDITFLTNKRYRGSLRGCQAGAVILTSEALRYWQGNALVVADPYLAYARLAQLLDTTPRPTPGIAATASIAADTVLGDGITIGDYSVIESGVEINDHVIIGAHCVIGKNTRIGAHTRLWMRVSLYHAVTIGEGCLIHAGAVIGSDGFGFAEDGDEWVKIPQLGGVSIGNNVEIGACTTIDRGTLDDTVIGDNVIIDNQCHIAHNVTIGAYTAVAGGVIMAGGLSIGRHCRIGGASVINGHMTICDRAIITGMAMVMRPITTPGIYSSGIPAQPNAAWRKTAAHLLRIEEMHKRVKTLECLVKQRCPDLAAR